MNETDVVFGGEKRLFKAIRETIENMIPPPSSSTRPACRP